MLEYTELQKDYANYRLERAKEDLEAARLLFENKNFRIANNPSRNVKNDWLSFHD